MCWRDNCVPRLWGVENWCCYKDLFSCVWGKVGKNLNHRPSCEERVTRSRHITFWLTELGPHSLGSAAEHFQVQLVLLEWTRELLLDCKIRGLKEWRKVGKWLPFAYFGTFGRSITTKLLIEKRHQEISSSPLSFLTSWTPPQSFIFTSNDTLQIPAFFFLSFFIYPFLHHHFQSGSKTWSKKN